MGAGYALDAVPCTVYPEWRTSFETQAKAAAVLLLLQYLLTLPALASAPLLVFVDDLTLLLILRQWRAERRNTL